jgi:hydroxymethylpyrimidine kinase/phosphomethylpyrimidine kinase
LKRRKILVAMTIAGSDPGGGAGLQSDIRTFAALGVYSYSVLTSVIAQSSSRVARVAPVTPALVTAQIEVLVAEARPVAIKTGALASAGTVAAIADAITKYKLPAPIVDPVMIASSGARLLERRAEAALRDRLIPLARIVTPNAPEAEALTGVKIGDRESVREAARKIVAIGARAVLIKGGHVKDRAHATDIFYDGRIFIELTSSRIAGGDAHGTGCVLSAAIAAYLARGDSLEEAVRKAKRFLTAALQSSFKIGKSRALLDQFAPRR